MRTRARSLVVLAVIAAASAACSAILGLDPPEPNVVDGGTTFPLDGAVTDSSAPDTSTVLPEDAGSQTCAPVNLTGDVVVDGGGVQSVTYQPLAQGPTADAGLAWQFFDTSTLTRSHAIGLSGGTFDGRYVYLPSRQSDVFRYDTQNGSGFDGGWEMFNTTNIAPGAPAPMDAGDGGDAGDAGDAGGGADDGGSSYAGGFSGAVFDGTYVYFVPNFATTGGARVPQRILVRFDPRVGQTNLKNPAAWTFFDLGTIADAGSLDSGFFGGTFDGRYLYLVPSNNGSPDGRVLRYDTTSAVSGVVGASFTQPSAWSAFDLTSSFTAGGPGTVAGFAGAVFDGTSIYLVPETNDAFDSGLHAGNSSFTARFDHVDASFTDPKSWSVFDLTLVSGNAENFVGGAYDGARYVYYAPRSSAVVARFDTKMPSIATASAWSYYDLQRLVPSDGGVTVGYQGAAFDGRFVTFLPAGAGFGALVRYDTASSFGADCAWSTLDLTTVSSGLDAGNFSYAAGAVFDGQYLYVVPASTGVVARFLVRTSAEPLAVPPLPAFHGSFL